MPLPLLLLALVASVGDPTDRPAELRAAAVALASTEPGHGDISDLAPLTDLVGDARVVSLGEMTHGDGTAFLARTRLVKFLHARMGFDVLAFESGLVECERVMEALRTDVPIDEAIALGIYDVWALSAEIRPLFEYVRATQDTDRPLRLVGFDPQFSAKTSAGMLRGEIVRALDPEAEVVAELERMLAALGDVSTTVSADAFGTWSALLDDLEQQLSSLTDDGAALVRQAIVSLRWQLSNRRLGSTAPPVDFRDLDRSLQVSQRIEAGNARDAGMADTLLWHLDERWPGSKIVLWAANNHVRTASTGQASDDPDVRERPMGELLDEALGEDLYTLVTTCFEGAWASPSLRSADGSVSWQQGTHERASAGTLAALLHETGLDVAWLDLDVASERYPWLASPLTLRDGFLDGPPGVLADACDAILFLDVIEPATPAEPP